jgi:peptidoglycan/LPS O-acetylase OafA/YrhL
MIGCELACRYKQLFHSRIFLVALIVIWAAIFHRFDSLGGYFDNTRGYPSSTSMWVYWPFFEGLFYSLITATYLGTSQLLPQFVDRALAFLGTLSYSFYLNHYIAIQISYKAFKWFDVETAGFWYAFRFVLFGAFPLMVVMSVMTHYLIERPFLLLRRPYLKPLADMPK